MKTFYKYGLLCFLGLSVQSLAGLGPLLSYFEPLGPLFTMEEAPKFEQLVEKNITELKKRKEQAQEIAGRYKVALDEVLKAVSSKNESIPRLRGIELEYVTQQRIILTNTNQMLSDLVQVYKDIEEIRSSYIKALEELKVDPEFKEKGHQFEQKSIYAIEDYQKVTADVSSFDAEIKGLKERLEKIFGDADTLKKNLELAQHAVNEKKVEQSELKEQKSEGRVEHKKFTLKQRGTLLDLEERLLGYKRDLAEALLVKADAQAEFLEFQIRNSSQQLDILQRHEDQVRHELRIDRKDILASERALRNQIQESSRIQEELARRNQNVTELRQKESEKYKITKDLAALSEAQVEKIVTWKLKPDSISLWESLLTLGRINNNSIYDLDVIRDILLAKGEQEKAKVIGQEVDTLVIHSWDSLTAGSYDGSTDALKKEIKKYEKIQSDLESALASLADKQEAASRLMANNTRIIDAMKTRIKEFNEQRETVFRNDFLEFNRLGKLLANEAFVDAPKRGEQINQLLELYTSITQQLSGTNQKIESMIRALKSKDRSKLVLPLWNGLKKFIPDVTSFFTFLMIPGQLHESITKAHQALVLMVTRLGTFSFVLLFLLMALLGLGALYFILKLTLYDAGVALAGLVPAEYGLIHLVVGCIAFAIQFLGRHITGIMLWSCAFGLVQMNLFDAYLSALFYLLSLVIWLYYVNRFVSFARQQNVDSRYAFAGKSYQERFFFTLSVLLNCTVIIIFFNAAIGRVIPQSDVPRILQAINFIIFQVSLIFMIGREQILRLIPHHSEIGKVVVELVDTYYYLFLSLLIFIIVMSNPYIGYGATFLYLILRLFLIALLVPAMMAIHTKFKALLGSLFFASDDEGRLTERFSHARTSYGLTIIGSIIFFSFLVFICALNIWGFSVGLKDLIGVFRKELYGYTSPDTGRRIAVTMLHIMQVILYVVAGVLIVFAINRFLLRRIFDLLLIKSGVQTIFLSLTRYVVILIALMIGMQSIGLGTWLLWTLAVIGGIAFANKEIIADFIGYFLILIQRPLKIGDYVSVSPELMGVVRHITLRSVILRRKNSVTVIIPNSYILSRPLTNWNYYRTYFAFEDIILTVSYKTDPHKVRELFLQVLDENYDVLRNPAPIVRLDGFTDIGFQFMIRGYLSHDKVLDQSDIASDIRLELVRILRQHGYDVAVPTRILKVEKDSSLEDIDPVEEYEDDE